MVRKLKQATLGGLKKFGVFTLARNGRWRRSRLLILAYHEVSLEDERLWDPALFMQPDSFRARISCIRTAINRPGTADSSVWRWKRT